MSLKLLNLLAAITKHPASSTKKIISSIVGISLLLTLLPWHSLITHAADNITVRKSVVIDGTEYAANTADSAIAIMGSAVTYYIDIINNSAFYHATSLDANDILPALGLSGSVTCRYNTGLNSDTHNSVVFTGGGSGSCGLSGSTFTGIPGSVPKSTALFIQLTGYIATATNTNTADVKAIMSTVGLVTGNDVAIVTVKQGTITGHVFFDDGTGAGTANNGIQDGSEANAPSILMSATNGTQTYTASTDSLGDYTITTIPGTYSVTVDPSNGYHVSTTDPVTGLVVTDGSTVSAGNSGLYNGADLSLDMTVTNSTPTSGDTVTFTITLTNHGPSDATAITVDNPLPSGLTYIASTITPPDTYTSATGQWTIPSLASGASRVLTVTTATSGSSAIINRAEISIAGQNDPDSTPGNCNSAPSEDDCATIGVTPITTSVHGFVYHVSNGSAYSGLTVTLVDTDTSVSTDTTTDLSGNYIFDNLTAGHHMTLTVSVPSGSTATANNGTGFVLTAGSNLFGNIGINTPVSTIGDFVFLDSNKNGNQDSGETGFPAVYVDLVDGSGSIINTVSTDPDGHYQFDNVVPGTYTLHFQLPSGYRFSTQHAGAATLLSDSDPNISTGITDDIVIIGGETITDIDAGIYSPNGSIGDFVWNDSNQNGVQDSGEPGIMATTVSLLSNTGATLQDVSTDTNGQYQFHNIAPGTYYVRFSLGTGFVFSPQHSASSSTSTDSDPSSSTGITDAIVLTDNQNITDIDAGMYSTTGSIGDFIWNDSNHNGLQDSGETGIAGVVVHLHDASDGHIVETVGSLDDGSYTFPSVSPGDYQVSFQFPIGFIISPIHRGDANFDSDANENTGYTSTFTLHTHETITNIDAGAYSLNGSIGDFIWNDLNQNGLQDSGEPGIPGITVELHDMQDDHIVHTIGSLDDGSYSFDNIPTGDYQVKFIPPSPYVISPSNIGSDDTRDSDVDPDNFRTPTFHLADHEHQVSIDAGMYTTDTSGSGAIIKGMVFRDINANGMQDESDLGQSTQTIQLLNGSGTTLLSKVTDADGMYELDNIAPGNYRIKFFISDGYIFSPRHAVGTDSTNDSDPDPDTGIVDITVIGNETILDMDAGIHANQGSIGDFVFKDDNHNGLQDSNESGIAGVIVTLFKEDNPTPIESNTTDTNGHYGFTEDVGRYYHLHFALPSGFHFSPINAGSENTDSDVDPITGDTEGFFLYGDEHHSDIDAGMYNSPTIHIVKTAVPSTPKPGEPVIYTLTVSNESSFPADDIHISDDLDDTTIGTNLIPTCIANMQSITPYNEGVIDTDSNTIHWTVGQLQAHGSSSVSFQGIIRSDISQATSCRNTAIAEGSDLNIVSSNVTISIPVLVHEAAISFEQHAISEAETVFNPGDTVQYQIDMNNSGSAGLSGLRIQDDLPPALTTLHDIRAPLGASIDSVSISGASSAIQAQANYEKTLAISNINLASNANAHVNYFAELVDSDHFPLRNYRLHQNAEKTDPDFYPERIKTSNLSLDQNPDLALNAPDDQAVTLGSNGSVTFEVSRASSNSKLIVDGDGPDFCVLELDNNDPDIDSEKYSVEVSQTSNASGFESVSRNNRNSNCFDLADADMSWARYIRIKDLSTNTFFSNQGVDIDAVCLLQIGGFVTNTAALYNGTTVLGTSDAEILVNFTEAFDHPLQPKDCRSKKTPTMAQSLPLPPPTEIEPEILIPQVPFMALPTTGPGMLVLPFTIGISLLWNRRRNSQNNTK